MFGRPLQQREATGSLFLRRIDRAIEAAGSDAFGRELLHVVREATGCESLSAYSDSAQDGPTLLFADDYQDRPRLQHVARHFAGLFWRQDPLHDRLDRGTGHSDVRLFASEIAVEDIQHAPYREFCYRPFSFRSRLSLHRITADGTIRVSIYRRRKFDDPQRNAFFDAAGLVTSLLQCHRRHRRAEGATDIADVQARLRSILPCLSRRETEVCAMIALGHTSESIALTLGVRVSTVQTYRKRAYARLSISSQNQLFRLIMPPDRLVP